MKGTRSTLTSAENDRLRRQAGLARFTDRVGPVKAPRFPVKSLTDAELAFELHHAPSGDWLDAVIEEANRRRRS